MQSSMNPHLGRRSEDRFATGSPPSAEGDESGGELDAVAAAFRLFSDETRLRVLALLMPGREFNVRSLCEQLEQSQPAVSHHLALLRTNGLLRIRREGKHNYYRLVPDKLIALLRRACQGLLERRDAAPPPNGSAKQGGIVSE